MAPLARAGRLLSLLLHRATSGLNIAGVAALLAMMLLGVADISGRRFLNRPIPGAFEVTEFLMAFLVFFALAYTQRVGGHVRVMVLTGRLSPRSQRVLDVIALGVALLLAVLVTWKSFGYFWSSWRIRETTVGLVDLPIYPALAAVPIGVALYSLQLLADLVRRLLPGAGK